VVKIILLNKNKTWKLEKGENDLIFIFFEENMI